MNISLRIVLLVTSFILCVFVGVAYGQEAVETAPEATTTEETTTTTPTTPRVVSQELLTELRASQVALEDAQKIIQYIIGKIVLEYQVDIRTEVINIVTGEITTVQTTTQ